MNKSSFVSFSSVYGSCENFLTYQGYFFIVFKLTALGYFIIKETRLLSFVVTAFGSITKGMKTQPLCLRLLIQYSQGDGNIVSRLYLKIIE